MQFSNAFLPAASPVIAYDQSQDRFIAGVGSGANNLVLFGQSDPNTWQQLGSGQTTNGGTNTAAFVLYDPAAAKYILGTSDGTLVSVYKSSDGNSWGSPLSFSFSASSQVTAIAFAGSAIYGSAGGCKATNNGGTSFTTVSTIGAVWSFSVDDYGVLWAVPAVSSGWHYFTTTDGVNWSTDTFGALGLNTGDTPIAVANGCVIVRTSSNQTYCIRPNAHLGTGSTGWTVVGSTLSTANKIVTAIGAGSEMYAIRGDGFLLHSDDQGRTWRRTQSQLYSGSNFTMAAPYGGRRIAACSGSLIVIGTGKDSESGAF